MSNYKSLTDPSTWEQKKGESNEHDTPTTEPLDDVDCALESDYDIPRNRESLNDLVKNLSFIVAKLKEQIQKLDDPPIPPTPPPPTSRTESI